MDVRPVFYEEQKFNQVWLWLLLMFLAILGWYIPLETVLNDPNEDTFTVGIVVSIWVLAGIVLPVLFGMLKLESEVWTDGIRVRFFPLHVRFKRFEWGEIARIEAVDYRPILDYGGWGIRYGSKGKAYNVSGKEGVMISFKDGRKDLLIGSRHPIEFLESVRMAKRKARR